MPEDSPARWDDACQQDDVGLAPKRNAAGITPMI